MTDQQTDMTAAELDELEKDLRLVYSMRGWSDHSSMCTKAANVLRSLRKQLDEAREQRNFYIDAMAETGKREAQMAAALLTEDRIERHKIKAADCPPASEVVLVSSIRRLQARAPASPSPVLRDADTAPALKTADLTHALYSGPIATVHADTAPAPAISGGEMREPIWKASGLHVAKVKYEEGVGRNPYIVAKGPGAKENATFIAQALNERDAALAAADRSAS